MGIEEYIVELADVQESTSPRFPLMPEGQAVDMGHTGDGAPLIDPRIFDSPEFFRNPYPYYRILRDHYPVYHDKLHNCYWVTRYDDITECYFDDEGFNTIPKGSSSGVLGNTQLELSGIEHRRRRNLYGQHLVGKSLQNRVPAIERLAREMIGHWDDAAAVDSPYVSDVDGVRTIELGAMFAKQASQTFEGQRVDRQLSDAQQAIGLEEKPPLGPRACTGDPWTRD